MNKISKRYKVAGVEQASNGVGVTTSARLYARKYFASQGNNIWASSPNDKLNDLLAMNFAGAQPAHRFKLKSGEVAEIRKSENFYFVAKMAGGNYVIIVIQSAYKEPSEEVRKRRLESQEWGGK